MLQPMEWQTKFLGMHDLEGGNLLQQEHKSWSCLRYLLSDEYFPPCDILCDEKRQSTPYEDHKDDKYADGDIDLNLEIPGEMVQKGKKM